MVSRVARWHPGPPRVAWCRLGLHALVALAGAGWAGATSAVQASLPAPTPIHWADTLWPLLLLVGAAQMLPSVRRDDAQAGAFGGFAIAAALVIFFDGAWAARLEESGWLIKLDGSSWHLVVVSSLTFLWPFLGRSLPRFAAAYRDTHAVLAAFCLVAPSSWVEQTLPLRALWCAPSLVLVGVLVGVATWRARPSTDLAPTAAATAAAIICCGAEVVLVITGLGSARPLPVVALAALVLGVLLTRTLRQGRLHNELEALRLHLERMVEDRTAELSTANQRLQGEIAERQLAEQGMRMLESAVEQSVDGIAVAGLEGGLLFLNQAWANMHGYEVMELLGYDLQVFHTREQFRDQVEPLLKLVASEGAQEAEIEHRRRGGATFPTWMTVTSLQDAAGAPMGYVFIARDLSERKRAEADRRALELRIGRAERLESLGTLAGGIAHDYNNILTGVLGNASLALSQLAGNAPTRPYLEAVEASAERAAGLTEQLLAFSGEERHLP
ncbi:MAG: PAS domain S-box protein, partial [Acidobacteriota bacterium]